MKIQSISGIALCVILSSGCVTNPNAKAQTTNTNGPAASAIANAPAIRKSATEPVAGIELPSNAPLKDLNLIADNRKESTGLLGKTITSKIKYNKNWHGELPHFNNYAYFQVTGNINLPLNTNIVNLLSGNKKNSAEIFAFIKENNNSAYFIDMLEIKVPKGYILSYERCTIGFVGLFKGNSGSDMYLRNPEKAWTIVNGRFAPMTNISKMVCEEDGL